MPLVFRGPPQFLEKNKIYMLAQSSGDLGSRGDSRKSSSFLAPKINRL